MVDFNKKILNTDKFRQAALFYKEHGCYTLAPRGTTDYVQFWERETQRCLNGYVAEDGDAITGYHYFYLNYSPIIKRVDTKYTDKFGNTRIRRERLFDFPEFWDGDYYFFNAVEEAEQQGKHLAVLKARKKGFSFKGSSMLVRNYALIEKSKSFAVASEQKFLVGDGLLTKAWEIMDFIDKNTEWSKRRLTATRMERVSGFKVKDEFGKETEQGYKSAITGVTLKNDPERLRGIRGKLILFEEGGKFPNLETAWRVAQPSMEDDDGTAFGLMLAFGTGGTEGGAFDGLKELFYNPKAFNVLAFPNIWDDNAEQTECGYFSPIYLNMEGYDDDGNYKFMDKDGNSLKEKAIESVIQQRNAVKDGGASQQSIDRFISERPMKPQEAVLELGKNIFPRKLLMDQLTRIRTNKKIQNMKHIVDLSWDGNGQVVAKEKKSGDITTYHLKKDDKPEGSVVIWEYPVTDAPFGLYVGGCLTPGETVWTQRGLVPVEQVVLGDSLVGKDGKYVSIKNIQLRDKVNESTYRIKPTGSYRTTNFTSEHPIWTGNRGFVNASELTTNDWLEIPNRYLSYFGDHKHQQATDREKKFAYFCGLFTGDGFTNINGNSHDVYMSIGKDEKDFAIFYDKLIEELFDRKCVHVHKNKELTRRFTHKELVEQLNSSIGTSAYNKRVPSWVMEGSYAVKLAFLQGFLDSDGSVLRDRNNIRINFTSVNLELLEDIQDLLFALEIKNSIVIHQKENTSKYVIHSLQSYRINIATDDNQKLAWNPVFESRKIKLAKETVIRGKSKMNIKFVNGSIWLKVEKIDKSCYTGVVYNFECETHTFMSRCTVTHNCDPYAKVSGFKIGQKRRTSRTDNTVLILLIAKGSKIV